jgi:hypothetical protein
MSSASPMAGRSSARLLRPPAQIPFFVCEVTLNIAGIAFILRTVVIVLFLPERLQTQRSLARRQRGLTAR